MEAGVASAIGLLFDVTFAENEPRLTFITLGVPTSKNPLKALMQGLSDDRPNHTYRITGIRCSKCGFLELYAVDP